MVTAPARLAFHARLVTSRAAHRLRRSPAVAVLAGRGDSRNFGDEWMFEALETGLPDCRLIELTLPKTEERLTRLGLSGDRLFSAVIVGGGTLMNFYFLPRLVPFLGSSLPMWSVGTGVGSAGFGMTEAMSDPSVWAEPLRRFRRVTVRGPLSQQALRGFGVDGAEAIGDVILLYASDKPAVDWASRRVLVNISGSPDETTSHGEGMPEHEVIASLGRALRRLHDAGWELEPFALHDLDLSRLATLERVSGVKLPAPIRVSRAADARRLVQGVRGLIGMRLHAAALGWMHGIPTLGLGYRNKTLDFAAVLGAEDQVVDLLTMTPAELEAATVAFLDRPSTAIEAPHARAIEARSRLRALLAEINDEICTRSGT